MSLEYELCALVRTNRTGSYATRANRAQILRNVAQSLKSLGFLRMNVHSLKPKHWKKLVKEWQVEGVSDRSIANRMSAIRWWAKAVGKQGVVPKSNADIGLVKGQPRHSSTSKATPEHLLANMNKISGKKGNAERYQLSAKLGLLFGLRCEESVKIVPSLADRGDFIHLKGSWCKGGRPRDIAIRTKEQREALDEAKKVAKGNSLIDPAKSYIKHVKAYAKSCKTQSLKSHGFRHFYAQKRYRELTGKLPPNLGGTPKRKMTKEERLIDKMARMQISHELGHGREDVTNAYLGY